MYSKVVIALTLCVLSTVSAGVVPVAAPFAAAGVIAPYATSYNAHTVNHNIAAPYVAATPVAAPVAVAKYVAAPAAPVAAIAPVAPVAKYVAAPVPAAAYTAYSAGAPVLPAAAYTAYSAASYPYLF
ncbi:angiomotin-like [Anopheles nili]|uniref:angiomotin-like n=1 Tax=Anopheles nili TaxID=185578 RepID=UPI00237A40FC|nr:angiomotin-like [Anopheles nili]